MPFERETKIENGVQLWPCRRCGNWFTKDRFYPDKRAKKWGIRAVCKQCASVLVLESRKNNPESARQTSRDWQKRVGYRQRLERVQKERERSLRRNKTLEARCRQITNLAIKIGILERPKVCPKCGKPTLKGKDYQETIVTAHHDDYFRPLEVKWFCRLCHAEYERERNVEEIYD